MKRIPVVSSTLASVGYQAANLTLELEFQSGEIYCYFQVPHELHRQLMEADSKGRFFNRCIRDRFPHCHSPRALSAQKTI